jgi:hypothetical protein
MNKNRLIEVVVTVMFIASLILYFLFGFFYFSGFEYASTINKIIISLLTANIYLGLCYFVCRFVIWVINRIRKFTKNK